MKSIKQCTKILNDFYSHHGDKKSLTPDEVNAEIEMLKRHKRDGSGDDRSERLISKMEI